MRECYVSMKDISKSFGKVRANSEVNLEVLKGEVHGLLGENGAGKSTLMNMLSGIYAPDGGSIAIHGEVVSLRSPKEAIGKGIGMIHQHFKLVHNMTAEENIIMGHKTSLFTSKHKRRDKIQTLMKKFGLEVDLDRKIEDLSVGEKQRVEIIKVLYRGADILILDEPTAVLTPQETKKLFEIIHNMREEGCAIIIITHKLGEIMEITNRVTVLRKGTTVETLETKTTNPKALTDRMVGRSMDLAIERVETDMGKEGLLKVSGLTARNNENITCLDQVTFQLHGGEILGVAGVSGSGQKELCEVLAGLSKVESGSAVYEGQEIIGKTPREIIDMGISMSFVPEDRLGMGLVASMDMVDNLLLKDYRSQKGYLAKRKPLQDVASGMIEDLEIVTPGIHTPVRQLSGGNIQKVLLGREIRLNPHLLITAYAVRGLDIGASHRIYDLLNEQKAKGVGILFIGEDLDVLMELCDRIMVMCDGKVTGIVDAKEITKEELGYMMAGKTLQEVAAC